MWQPREHLKFFNKYLKMLVEMKPILCISYCGIQEKFNTSLKNTSCQTTRKIKNFNEIYFAERQFQLLLGGLSLHLNHLIESQMTNYDWPFGTLPFGLFGSNLDTRDLETYPRTYSGHFWNMSIFDDSRAIWVLFRKWVVSENQSFLNEGVIITPPYWFSFRRRGP